MNEILTILRALIGDLDGSVYSDTSLNGLIIVSAIVVQQELYFETTYIVDITLGTITPDPTDNAFKLIVAYKAAILLIQTELRKYSSQSIRIVDGPSTIDLSNVSKDFNVLLKSLLEQYDRMRRDYTLGSGFGYAVLSPTTVSYISPSTFS